MGFKICMPFIFKIWGRAGRNKRRRNEREIKSSRKGIYSAGK